MFLPVHDARTIEVSWSQERIQRLRRWRLIGILGGLSLTAAFFVPHAFSVPIVFIPFLTPPGSIIVPRAEVFNLLTQQRTPDQVISTVSRYLLPYAFGLVCAMVGARSFDFRLQTQRSLGRSCTVFFGVLFLIGAARANSDSPVALLVLFLFGLIVVRCVRDSRGAGLSARFWCALGYTLGFNFHMFEEPRYGSWMAMIGAACIGLSAFAETRLRCRAGLPATVWKLLNGRVDLPDLEGPQCFECGYLLIGLTSNRCPECGLRFQPSEHGVHRAPQAAATALTP